MTTWFEAVRRWWWRGPLNGIPASRAEVERVFGDPGSVRRPDMEWRDRNIRTYRDLPGVPVKWYFKFHRLAEPYLREGLRRAEMDSDYVIQRAGGFVHRHVRHGGSHLPLSYHSYGCAIDIDPKQNYAKRFKGGRKFDPWSDEWMSLWPTGFDRPFVEAMESVGFTWGGRWKYYTDPMHFELKK